MASSVKGSGSAAGTAVRSPDIMQETDEGTGIRRGAWQHGDVPTHSAGATKIEFIINLTPAKALGLVVPQSIQLRASEVIE